MDPISENEGGEGEAPEAPVEPDVLETVEESIVDSIIVNTGLSIEKLAHTLIPMNESTCYLRTKHPARVLHIIEKLAQTQTELLAIFNAEARSYLPPPEDAEMGTTNPSETFGATVIREVLPVVTQLIKDKEQPPLKDKEQPPQRGIPGIHRHIDFYGIDSAVRALQAVKEAGDADLEAAIRKAIHDRIDPMAMPVEPALYADLEGNDEVES
jgi:hypothetical protein